MFLALRPYWVPWVPRWSPWDPMATPWEPLEAPWGAHQDQKYMAMSILLGYTKGVGSSGAPRAPWGPKGPLGGPKGPLGAPRGPLGPWDPWAASGRAPLGPLGPWAPWAASGRAPRGPLGPLGPLGPVGQMMTGPLLEGFRTGIPPKGLGHHLPPAPHGAPMGTHAAQEADDDPNPER